ncbi:MAG: hypothetical protein L6Q97_26305 [Thermoanaerobaculia bacterium]|nr:hypothetical protein [Thermoanaerobaculia bacterium]
MENQNLNLLTSPDGVGRMPWKAIGILFLLLFSAMLVLNLLSIRRTRKLKRRITGLTADNEIMQESLNAGLTELDTLKQSAPPDLKFAPLPEGYRMPILNPGLKFNIQPEFGLPYPAFNAWNSGGTLRVFAMLDLSVPVWTFKLYSTGDALLKESNIPIEGAEPDGKRIATEIRSLLEGSIDVNSA